MNSDTTLALVEKDKRHHLHPLTNPVTLEEAGPDMVTRAEGVYLYTSDDRKLLDVGSGLSNVNIGYGNPRLCDAAYKTMQQLSFGHAIVGRSNPWAAALSAKLAEISPKSFQRFFFASSGSEAIESSIKIALRYWRLRNQPGKRAVISRQMSYHGNTLFAASLTANNENFHKQFGLPISDMIHHAASPYWYRDGKGRSKEQFGLDVAHALEQQILSIGPENIAAFVGDAIQTGGNMLIPPESYWPEVRLICTKYDILLIADEIISGFGKTGRMFGFENFGFEPDMFVMAKGLSSGYFPISSVAINDKISDVMQLADELFMHVFTNSGHPVGAAVALENIAVIEELRLIDRVRNEIGPYFNSRLQEFLAFPCVGEVRSMGVLGAIDIDLSKMGSPKSKPENDAFLDTIAHYAWKRGLVIRAGLSLPMIITKDQIDTAIDILKAAIGDSLAQRI
jgi:putrescine aminotransferase